MCVCQWIRNEQLITQEEVIVNSCSRIFFFPRYFCSEDSDVCMCEYIYINDSGSIPSIALR